MIQAKQELLQALSRALAQLAPDAPPAAAFESPKQAAHGDLAITAAMPLSRRLKKNPREIAQALVDALQAEPAEIDLARRVLATLPSPPLYARVDLVPASAPGGALLLELELTEPSLFLSMKEGSAERFARAIQKRLHGLRG